MLLENKNGLHFHEIADAVVILAKKGTYKQAKVYIRGKGLYAKYGSGFIQLMPHGTSAPDVRIDGISIPGLTIETGPTGRYEVKNLESAMPAIEGTGQSARIEG